MSPVAARIRSAWDTTAGLRREAVTRLFGFDVFVSHTRDGTPYAEALEKALAARGRRCFLDRSELHAGVGLRRGVADALGRSALLVVVASDGARTAPWTLGESRFYRRWRPRDPIVPVAFGAPGAEVSWVAIHRDLFDTPADAVDLVPGWRGRVAGWLAG